MKSELFDFLPIFLQIAFAVVFVFGTIWVSQNLGPSHKASRKSNNFECGLESMGDARSPFSIKYFLVAILFVLFDIEVIFMYPWAINFKEFGWDGVYKMLGFLVVLLIGYIYVKKRKAFEWDR
ncbi:MAG: NADH-quinone oxidoreductase subunit A [Dysgonamonadaceae bacterium]